MTTEPSSTYTKVCALCRCTADDAPGAYSTVSIEASLPAIPVRSFVISGVTFASSADATIARHSVISTSFIASLLQPCARPADKRLEQPGTQWPVDSSC